MIYETISGNTGKGFSDLIAPYSQYTHDKTLVQYNYRTESIPESLTGFNFLTDKGCLFVITSKSTSYFTFTEDNQQFDLTSNYVYLEEKNNEYIPTSDVNPVKDKQYTVWINCQWHIYNFFSQMDAISENTMKTKIENTIDQENKHILLMSYDANYKVYEEYNENFETGQIYYEKNDQGLYIQTEDSERVANKIYYIIHHTGSWYTLPNYIGCLNSEYYYSIDCDWIRLDGHNNEDQKTEIDGYFKFNNKLTDKLYLENFGFYKPYNQLYAIIREPVGASVTITTDDLSNTGRYHIESINAPHDNGVILEVW